MTGRNSPAQPAAANLRRGRPVLILMILLVGLLPPAVAQAQDAASSQQQVPTPLSPQDLAKSAHNPFEEFVKIPIEPEAGFGIGPHHDPGASLNIEPTLPLQITDDWDVITQPNLTIAYQPSPHGQFGLQDFQTLSYLTPAHAAKWIWGIGPIFQFPTASSKELGTGHWCAGPTAAVVYSNGPWFNGIRTYQLMSFAGNRSRGSVNLTYVEPDFSYNFESGWYIDTDPAITFDWTANTANAWTLPVGADVGKAFNIGKQAMTMQIGSYDFVKYPPNTPQWGIRLSITFLFPTGF
ncbi:MAG TPA: hypothetical protein VMU16_10040 [Candidatus Binataceae bacterium]|nr:hypothetical protein [Candidatus Binataceae bacterium]